MNSKKTDLSLYKIPLVLIVLCIYPILSSCATSTGVGRFYSQLNKNSEIFKNKSLDEVDPQFWKELNARSIYIICEDISFFLHHTRGTSTTGAVGKILPVAGGLLEFGNDAVFDKKISGFMQSYNWKLRDYFLGVLKQNMNLPKQANISFMIKEKEDFPLPENISDKDIIIFLNSLCLYMIGEHFDWGEPKAPLRGEVGVTIASGKAWQGFIQEYNGCLPLTLATDFSLSSDSKTKLYSELRQIKTHPDLYMGNIAKKTESYGKSKWTSEGGIFLEQQLKALLGDLAKGAAKLLKKD